GEGAVHEQSRTPFSWSGSVRNRAAATLELAIAYFPGWEVRVDGHAVAASPAESTGLMRVPLPPGEHSVTAQWKRTPVRWACDLLSLFSLLAGAIALRRQGVARYNYRSYVLDFGSSPGLERQPRSGLRRPRPGPGDLSDLPLQAKSKALHPGKRA